jgi:hypothetical protein
MALNVKDLLLAARLDRAEVADLLRPYGIKDAVKADANLQSLATDPVDRELLANLVENLLVCVSQSADPDQSLNYFERFARAALNKPQLFSYLQDSPRTLEVLMRTLGASPYMAEILIRDPQHFYWLTDPQTLSNRRKKRDIQREVAQTLSVLEGERTQLDYLRVVQTARDASHWCSRSPANLFRRRDSGRVVRSGRSSDLDGLLELRLLLCGENSRFRKMCSRASQYSRWVSWEAANSISARTWT